MSVLTHANRQAILNRVYARFIIKDEPLTRSARSVVSLFDWAGCLRGDRVYCPANRYKLDTPFVDKLQAAPGLASALFGLDDDDELDNDDFAFLIDLESEHRSAVATAWQHFDVVSELDPASFRHDLSQRLDRFPSNEGLDRPASTLLAS